MVFNGIRRDSMVFNLISKDSMIFNGRAIIADQSVSVSWNDSRMI